MLANIVIIKVQTDYPFVFLFCFYGDYAIFVNSSYPWFGHSGVWWDGPRAGGFYFNHDHGGINNKHGSRLVEFTIIF